jgi:5-methylthioribose kinase
MQLTTSNAGDVLVALGVAPGDAELTVEPLSGGIANVVLAARWDGGSVVVKQSLAQLRVDVEWHFDRSRTLIERDCIVYLGTLLAGSVPSVLASDDDALLFVMSHAPEGGVVWKEALLAGDVALTTARQAGTWIGSVHALASVDAGAERRFDDLMPLIEGRVDPFHRTAAAANPDLAEVIEAEVERLLSTRRTLVLGDWSPKNVIAYPERILALDFEVAHWGDPSFDVAFLLTHLALKAHLRPADAAAYRAAAAVFLDAYGAAAGSVAPPDEDVVAELGCLLLSRVDGKSRAEYLTAEPTRAAVRALARELLTAGERRLAPALDRAIGDPHSEAPIR